MATRPEPDQSALDRHALALAIWLSAGFIATVLLVHAFDGGSPWTAAGGFAAFLAGFVAHVIVNAVWRTGFTPRELALGLCLYGAGLVWFLLALLFGSVAAEHLFVPVGLGFLAILIAVVFYLVTYFGVRRAFEGFDVIRDFRPRHQKTRA